MKLEHIAPYLPYSLEGTLIRKTYPKSTELCVLTGKILDLITMAKYEFKPRLRPLSDLTREITHNGETFVPADILFPKEEYKTKFERDCAIESLRLQNAIQHSCSFFIVVQTLFKWHFDVFGLIESGEAIDINTLSKH